VLDTGGAKLMTSFLPLHVLRTVPGFENARFADPFGGGRGNSIRYVNMAPRNDALKIEGLDNVFCGGEKAGLLVGHTEAIVTGTLAGYNAVCCALGKEVLVVPDSLALGDAIRHVREQMQTEKGLGMKFTFSGSVYFERMKQRDGYLLDIAEIRRRVAAAGLTDVFAQHSRPVAARPAAVGAMA
jgi:folate-dependent tRNA-U54 methylase TrmFO/GidA